MRYAVVFLVALLTACSEIGPYIQLDDNATPADTVAVDTTQSRVVLLEIFTGASCPNCPKGRQIADNLMGTYAGRLQVVEIHQGPLAHPAQQGDPDLRTTDGDELAAYLGPPPYWPVGAVDRRAYQTSPGVWQTLVDRNLWSSLVAAAVDSPLKVALGAQASFDEASRKLKVDVGVRFLRSVEEALHLTVMLVEDSIVAAQLDGVTLITDYVHHDVLRDILTPFSGTPVTGNRQAGTSWYWSVADYVLPPDWNARHCRVVVLVARSGGSYEVLQSHQIKLLP
ncbi:MAG: Omp28-related outer membrane protein [Chitinophagales bacterium]|nr:Omp28-related outer membrane protein [Chitinophagales bacterium]MDW8393519.1 Omp28-related outer membrane protein [Chitinophagales bacterium]